MRPLIAERSGGGYRRPLHPPAPPILSSRLRRGLATTNTTTMTTRRGRTENLTNWCQFCFSRHAFSAACWSVIWLIFSDSAESSAVTADPELRVESLFFTRTLTGAITASTTSVPLCILDTIVHREVHGVSGNFGRPQGPVGGNGWLITLR